MALAAGPRDQVAAHTDLAEAYWQTGQSADARQQTLAALELAPTYARAQDLLLAIVDEREMTARLALAVIVSAAVTLVAGVVAAPAVEAQLARDTRFAGLQWTFVRIKYTANTQPGRYRMEYWGEPWAIDGPAAEQNLSRRIKSVTAIDVGDPVVLTLEDPKLWEHPWIYFVEPGNLRLKDTRGADPARVPAARRYRDVRRLSRPVRMGQPRA